MRILLLFILIILLSNCTTVELAKEVTKATKSIKASVNNITKGQENNKSLENNNLENIVEETINDKQKITKKIANLEIEKKETENIIKEQKKKSKINFLGKTFYEVKLAIGDPILIRIDGNSKTIRFDNSFCRLFLFSNNLTNNAKVKYFEIRNNLGKLIINKEEIKKCYQAFKLI